MEHIKRVLSYVRRVVDDYDMIKSGDKIAKYFGISKYTLYSYIDTKQQEG